MVLSSRKVILWPEATARVTADFLLAADSGLLRSMRPASRWPAADPGRGRNTNAHGWLPASRAADTGSPMSRLPDSQTGAEVVGCIPRKQAAGSRQVAALYTTEGTGRREGSPRNLERQSEEVR